MGQERKTWGRDASKAASIDLPRPFVGWEFPTKFPWYLVGKSFGGAKSPRNVFLEKQSPEQ